MGLKHNITFSFDEIIDWVHSLAEHTSKATLLVDGNSRVHYSNIAARCLFIKETANIKNMSLRDLGISNKRAWQVFTEPRQGNKHKNSPINLHTPVGLRVQFNVQTLYQSQYTLYLLISDSDNNTILNSAPNKSDIPLSTTPDKQFYSLRQRLNKLENTANIGTWEVDLFANKLYWSDQTKRIHEVADNYIPDVNTSIAFYKKGFDRDRISEVYQQAVNYLIPWDEKLRIVTAAGNERIMRVIGNAESAGGVCTRIFGVFQDITSQELVRQELQESEKMLQHIMDRSSAVVYVKDIEGRYTFVNEKYLSIFGFDRNQVLGKDDFDLLPAKVAIEVTNNDKMVISSESNMTLEEQILQQDGTHTYISEKFPLFDATGKVVAICGFSTDISIQRKNEERLKQTQKLEALGQLSGGIAHDMNNLLSIISGHCELIALDKSGLSPDVVRSNLQIARACERGAYLTKRLLGFSRHHSTKLTVCNLNDLLTQNLELFKRLLTASVQFQIIKHESLWDCEVNAFEFEDALLNLIINAQQAIASNGAIQVKTTNKVIQHESHANPVPKGEYVCVCIEDNGCGMDEHTQKRIFDPFYTTKGDGGSGLGMSQVYGFMKRVNGHIQVSSEQGQGTIVEMYFPRAQRLTLSTPPREQLSSNQNDSTSKHIAVVDDEPELVYIISSILKAHGFKVAQFNNPDDALKYIETNDIDILITDIIMPSLSGIALSEKVRQKQSHVKVLFISGYADRHLKPNQKTAPIPLLFKPFNAKQLLTQVNALITAK